MFPAFTVDEKDHFFVARRTTFHFLFLLSLYAYKNFIFFIEKKKVKKMYPRTVFSAFGDWGALTPSRDRVLHALACMHTELDFCILLGDNFYPDGVSGINDPKWKQQVVNAFPPSLRLYAILGNHDYHLDPTAQVQYSTPQWQMPSSYYDLVRDHIHILFLDTTVLAPAYTTTLFHECGVHPVRIQAFQTLVKATREAQLCWLEDRLSHSRSTWKIVVGHYPLATNGPHDTSQELYQTLLPLLQRYGVHLYLAGHDHNAQVLQHESPLCSVVSGAVSFVVAPHRPFPVPGTLFVSTVPGQFVCEATRLTLELKYVDVNHEIRYKKEWTV